MQQTRYVGPIEKLYGLRATVIFPGESIHEITPGHVVAQFSTPLGKPEYLTEYSGWREYPISHFQHPSLPFHNTPPKK